MKLAVRTQTEHGIVSRLLYQQHKILLDAVSSDVDTANRGVNFVVNSILELGGCNLITDLIAIELKKDTVRSSRALHR